MIEYARSESNDLSGAPWRFPAVHVPIRQFTPIPDIPSGLRLRSSSSDDLLVPDVRLPNVGRKAFFVAYGTTHLSTVSAHLQKTTETASVSTFVPWPSLIN